MVDKKKMDRDDLDLVDVEDSLGSPASQSGVSSDGEDQYEHEKEAFWDSALLTEAKSVLNEFLEKKERLCKNCKRVNPKITKPTFEWFHLVRLT